ncbi:MAG: transcriptional repressor [Paludibacteraceae bacterium]|nr:transcriptional repressor [Paludibacteraceae bacterium]
MTHQENTYIQASRQLNRYLAEKGMRTSMERMAVLQLFCSDKKYWTSRELIDEAEKKHICRATVYNALNLLIEAQLIRTRQSAGINQTPIYELTENQHNHIQIICNKCHRQMVLKDTGIARMISDKKYNNFLPKHFELTIYGECKVCRRKQTK